MAQAVESYDYLQTPLASGRLPAGTARSRTARGRRSNRLGSLSARRCREHERSRQTLSVGRISRYSKRTSPRGRITCDESMNSMSSASKRIEHTNVGILDLFADDRDHPALRAIDVVGLMRMCRTHTCGCTCTFASRARRVHASRETAADVDDPLRLLGADQVVPVFSVARSKRAIVQVELVVATLPTRHVRPTRRCMKKTKAVRTALRNSRRFPADRPLSRQGCAYGRVDERRFVIMSQHRKTARAQKHGSE